MVVAPCGLVQMRRSVFVTHGLIERSVRTMAEPQIPEPDLTPAGLIARARALQPLMRENRIEAAQLGTYPREIHEEFQRAGFYRILQPKMYGGLELDLELFFRVMTAVSQGDPGMGWCLTLGTSHTLPLVAHFAPRVVEEAYGDDGLFIAPHSAQPQGTAEPVEGGYRVSGRWAYASGAPYSTHMMCTTLVVDVENRQVPHVVLIPRADYEVLNDWGGGSAMALQASGSNTVAVDDVFVPYERSARYDWHVNAYDTGSFGSKSTGNPMYLGNCSVIYHGGVGCTQVGAARAALDEFEKTMKIKKRSTAPQVLRYLHEDAQRVYGQAVSMVDSAETILFGVGRRHSELSAAAGNGESVTVEDWLRLSNQIYTATRLAWEAGELMFRSVGSSVANRADPLQDYFLALQMQRTQAHAQSDSTALLVARAHFGLELVPPTGGVSVPA